MSTKYEVETRALQVAKFIIDNCATIRQAADAFDVSKSTIYKDITVRLREAGYYKLHEKCREVLDYNKSQRHIRGGFATKKKYCGLTDEERDFLRESMRREEEPLKRRMREEAGVA